MNIPIKFNKAGSKYYMKVHVRGCCIGFSPSVINEYLEQGKLIIVDKVPSLKNVSQEITEGTYKDWHRKGMLPNASLSVKFVILNRIGVANWAPRNHNSGITTSLAKII